jgi:hypothetical protein
MYACMQVFGGDGDRDGDGMQRLGIGIWIGWDSEWDGMECKRLGIMMECNSWDRDTDRHDFKVLLRTGPSDGVQ